MSQPPRCADCGQPFGPNEPDRPFLWQRGPLAGRVVHKWCAAEAVKVWAEYEAMPGWRRLLVRVLARLRRSS
jgi:hypothetical protein